MNEPEGKEQRAVTPAGKVAVTLLVLLAAFVLTLPAAFVDKESRSGGGRYVSVPNWRDHMPRAGMTPDAAAAALLRARMYFEAEVVPALMDAGFRDGNAIVGESMPVTLVEGLWSFHAFPELQARLLADLTDTGFSLFYRLERFTGMTEVLDNAATVLAAQTPDFRERSYAANPAWLLYFRNDPRLFGTKPPDENANRKGVAGLSDTVAVYEAKLELAGRILTTLYYDMQGEEAARLARRQAQGDDSLYGEVWNDDAEAAPWENYAAYSDAAAVAVQALWESRERPESYRAALELFTSGQGSPAERYSALPLVALNPKLSPEEYLFWARYREDVAEMDRRLGPNPYYYGYILDSGSSLDALSHEVLAARDRTDLAENIDMPGVTVTPLDQAPASFDDPAFSGVRDPLYLMIDTPEALPDVLPEALTGYDMSRALPILGETVWRRLERQPRLLPLDPLREEDRALLDWYLAQGGAADRIVLLAASGSPEEVARHLGYVHQIWWPQTDYYKNTLPGTEPMATLLHMGGGPFMHAILNTARGDGLGRFLGPVSGLWYRIEGLDADEWFAAIPEEDLPRIVSDESSPVLYLTDMVNKAMTRHFLHSKTVIQARKLHARYGGEGSVGAGVVLAGETPQETYDFLHSRRGTLADSYGIYNRELQEQALELFWRFRNDGAATATLERIFEQDAMHPWHRLEEACRAMGLNMEEL